MKPQRIVHTAPRFLLALLLAALLVVSTGCDAARQLRQAQDAHERGAQLENAAFARQAFVDSLQDAVASSGAAGIPDESADGHYRTALGILQGIDEGELRQDGLLGAKLLLEAKCHYELGAYDQALPLAVRAAGAIDRGTLRRDWVIATALPALIINDEVYDKLNNPSDKKLDFARANARLLTSEKSALSYLNRAKPVAKDRPIEVWVAQLELILYVNAGKAAGKFNQPSPIDQNRNKLIDQCDALQALANTHTGDPDLAKAIADVYRVSLFGTAAPARNP